MSTDCRVGCTGTEPGSSSTLIVLLMFPELGFKDDPVFKTLLGCSERCGDGVGGLISDIVWEVWTEASGGRSYRHV